MFTAKIITVEKNDDSVKYSVEYTDGTKTYTKDYTFVMVADIERSLDETILSELKRINDIETIYDTLTAKVGTTYELA